MHFENEKDIVLIGDPPEPLTLIMNVFSLRLTFISKLLYTPAVFTSFECDINICKYFVKRMMSYSYVLSKIASFLTNSC